MKNTSRNANEIAFPISLRDVRKSDAHSEETTAFEAKIVDANGRLLGSVRNDGRGGAHVYYWRAREIGDQVGAWALSQPAADRLRAYMAETWGGKGGDYVQNNPDSALEVVINEALDAAIDEPLRAAYAKNAKGLGLPALGATVSWSDRKGEHSARVIGWASRSKTTPIVLRNETHEFRVPVSFALRNAKLGA